MSSLWDQFVAFVESSDPETIHGIKIQKINKGRLSNIEERDGKLYFSMTRHKSLDDNFIPYSNSPMACFICKETNYCFNPEEKDITEFPGKTYIEFDIENWIETCKDNFDYSITYQDNKFFVKNVEINSDFTAETLDKMIDNIFESSKYYINNHAKEHLFAKLEEEDIYNFEQVKMAIEKDINTEVENLRHEYVKSLISILDEVKIKNSEDRPLLNDMIKRFKEKHQNLIR